MRRTALAATAALAFSSVPLAAEIPVSLRGSPASMVRQNSVAKDLNFVFAGSAKQLADLEESGQLVRLQSNQDYEIADFVSWNLARPELRLFVERLAQQYRAATGEKLVVTSLTRPAAEQPGNSHALSVHPTGMAVDLRVSQRAASREWLESALLGLEGSGVLDITREYSPPHYHVALFPVEYMAYVQPKLDEEAALAAAEAAAEAELAAALAASAGAAANTLVATEVRSGAAPRWASAWPVGLALLIGGMFTLARRHRLFGLSSASDR